MAECLQAPETVESLPAKGLSKHTWKVKESCSALHVPAESEKSIRYFHMTDKKPWTHQDTAALSVH